MPFDLTLTHYNTQGEREVIGFVSAGEYSYIRGRGSALGFIALNELFPPTAHPTTVLIRNTSSPFFFLAHCSILHDD